MYFIGLFCVIFAIKYSHIILYLVVSSLLYKIFYASYVQNSPTLHYLLKSRIIFVNRCNIDFSFFLYLSCSKHPYLLLKRFCLKIHVTVIKELKD